MYGKYCVDAKKNKEKAVSRTLFYKLKPFWVVPLKVSARDTRMCNDHENFKLIFQKLRYYKIIKEKNSTEFIKTVCCDNSDKKCMYRECHKCKNLLLTNNNSDEITWYETWITEQVTRTGSKGSLFNVKVTSKKKVDCTISELITHFNSVLPKYLKHVFVTNHQFHSIREIKKNLSKNEILMVLDFSQNYNCKYSKEIHSIHFGASKKQVTLQSGGYYYKDDSDNLQFSSFATVSDCLRHDTAAAWTLLKPAIQKAKEAMPNLKAIHFQSDGPTTQYKNKTNFFLMNYFCNYFDLESATWNYTAAGHGKSEADGVHSSVKSMCDSAVACGQDVLCDKDMVDVVQSKGSKINMFLIKEQDIEQTDTIILNKLDTIKGTTQFHQVIWKKSSPKEMGFRFLTCVTCSSELTSNHYGLQITSSYDDESNTKHTNDFIPDENTYKIGDWIAVIYEKVWYPGEIVDINNNILCTKFLCRGKKTFLWPKVPDIQNVFTTQVICKIESPSKCLLKNKTETFKFCDEQLKFINNCVENCEIYEI